MRQPKEFHHRELIEAALHLMRRAEERAMQNPRYAEARARLAKRPKPTKRRRE